MTRRARLLTLGIVLAIVAGLGVAAAVSWFQRRALVQRAHATSADAVVAVASDGLVDRIVSARTAGLQGRDAITRTATTTALAVQRARRAHEREVAERRAEARHAQREPGGIGSDREAPPPPRPSGGLVVGDSVALGAKSCLEPLGYELDAEVGRQFDTGLAQLRQHAASGLPDTVVIGLGTNGPFDSGDFAAVMALAGTERRVVWVTIALPDQPQYAFRESLNQLITALAAGHPNARVADFASNVAEHPEWMFADGIHLNSAGCAGFTAVVDAAVRDP